MKKKILIIFPDSHLAYSPTTLNLKEELKKYFDIKILAFDNDSFFYKLKDDSIVYLRINNIILYFILRVIRFFHTRIIRDNSVDLIKKILIYKYLLLNKYDRVITIDLMSLWYVKGIVKSNLDNLSLELNQYSKYLILSIKNIQIDNLIIQDENRLKFYTHKKYKNVFFVQNSPPFYEDIQELSLNKKFNNKFVYAGTTSIEFGIFSCLSYIKENSDFNITIMGAIYPNTLENIISIYCELLHQKKIIIDDNYYSEYNYCLKLSDFSIGFCFYEFFHPNINKKFNNYYYAPSGKMFKYLASGVPIIGIDIPGLSIIKEYNAGILLKDITNSNINNAVEKIKNNYQFYVNNCFNAAKNYDFTTNVKNYINKISL